MVAICPDHKHLQSFLLGDVSDEQGDALHVHLQNCETCQSELATMEPTEDTFVELVKQASQVQEDQYSGESECRQATARALAALAIADSTAGLPGDFPKTIGEYNIVRPLGRGGMGHIFLGQHTKLEREVAIKFIAHHRRWDNSMRDRFASEMRAIGQLNHPNIVQAHDAREVDGVAVLVTEFIDGLDLGAILRRCGSLAVADACAIGTEVCRALSYIDSKGLVHRDIKPSNIMIDQQGQVKLLDLGLARIQNDETENVKFTATGQAIGSADYLAPEQINDSHNVDMRADIYGLGCSLYKLLSGRAPFADENYATAFAKMTAHVSEQPESLIDICDGMPPALSGLVDDMLAKSPADRPQSVEEVSERLQPFATDADLQKLVHRATGLSDQRLPVRASSLDESSGRPKTKASGNRRVPIIAALATGLLGFLFGIWLGITITIKKPDGTLTRVEIPDGSTAIVDSEGNLEILLGDGQELKLPSSQVQIQSPTKAAQSQSSVNKSARTRNSNPVDHNKLLFPINMTAEHPLFDKIEPGDRVDLFVSYAADYGVESDVSEATQQSADNFGYWEHLLASNKLVKDIHVDAPLGHDTLPSQNLKRVFVELTSAENDQVKSYAASGWKPELRSHDLIHQLVRDRMQMKGVWRTVYLRLFGRDDTADAKDQAVLITGRDIVLFQNGANLAGNHMKMEMDLEGDEIKLSWHHPDPIRDAQLGGQRTVLYRFLENGRLDIAFNEPSSGESAKVPLTFENANMFMRLERVRSPQDLNQRSAFEALASLDTAPIKLEMYLAQKPGVGELPDSFERGKVESTGEAIWHGPTPIITNRDLVSAQVADEDEPYQRLEIELTDAGAQRVRLATEKNRGKLLAIYLDGKLVIAPEIIEPISQRAAISGNFSKELLEKWAAGIVPILKLPITAAPQQPAPAAEVSRIEQYPVGKNGSIVLEAVKCYLDADSPAKITYVAELNLLVVEGPESVQQKILVALRHLNGQITSAERKGRFLVSYPHEMVGETVHDTLQSILQGREGVRLQLNEETGDVVVFGTRRDHQAVLETLKLLNSTQTKSGESEKQ